jgi:integrase
MRAKGEGSVYQRKDGRWVATLYDDTGKRRSLYGRTEQAVVKRRLKAQREGLPAGQPISVELWLQRWQTGLHLRPSTMTDYASKSKRISAEIGRVRLDRLTADQIEHTYAKWTREGLSPGMVRNLHRVLHAALQVAYRRGLIVRNPASQVRAPTPRPSAGTALTVTQAKIVLQVAATQPFGVRWWLALLLGMRQGEVLNLQWPDLNLDHGTLTVQRETKTRASQRTLPLPTVVVAMLQALPRTSVFVFPRPSGQRRDSKADWNEWQLLLARCQLPRVRVHDCRHTTPTLLAELGVHPRVVAAILGHATTNMTLNVYTQVHDPSMRAAVDELTALLTATMTAEPVAPDGTKRRIMEAV